MSTVSLSWGIDEIILLVVEMQNISYAGINSGSSWS